MKRSVKECIGFYPVGNVNLVASKQFMPVERLNPSEKSGDFLCKNNQKIVFLSRSNITD